MVELQTVFAISQASSILVSDSDQALKTAIPDFKRSLESSSIAINLTLISLVRRFYLVFTLFHLPTRQQSMPLLDISPLLPNLARSLLYMCQKGA
jgi:hypothetical protein